MYSLRHLDAFWSREPGTISNVLDKAKRGLAIATSLGFTHSLFRPRGPFPPVYSMGMGVAVVMVQRLLGRGRYARTLQFETV